MYGTNARHYADVAAGTLAFSTAKAKHMQEYPEVYKDAKPVGNGGIWGHSSSSATDEYLIFCVGNDKVREAMFRSWATADNVGFKSLIGCYKGVTEAAFIVNLRQANKCHRWYENEATVLQLSGLFRDGVAYGRRHARLMDVAGGYEIAALGAFRETPQAVALAQPSWTYDPATATYWTTTQQPKVD